jgi:hypothetical protein
VVVEKDKMRQGKEEEQENGAFVFVNGNPETEKKGKKKPRTVVIMDGVLLVVCFLGGLLFRDVFDHFTTTSGLESVVAVFFLSLCSILIK